MYWPTASTSTKSTVTEYLRAALTGLVSRSMVVRVWLPVLLITALHYATGQQHYWVHDVARRLYYLPILFAAFDRGLWGGLGSAAVVVVVYAPHAFTHLMRMDPAHTLEKVMEIGLYLVVGGVCGLLVSRERARQREVARTADKLQQALTDQEKTRQQLVRAGRLAALGELVAGVAHEVKNPLHTLRGTAEVVDEAVADDAPQRPMWELHLGEIDRLAGVADRFLSFARPTPPERRPVDLHALLRRADDLVAAQARQQGVTVTTAPPPNGENPTVQADEQQLTQVLLNLTLNAVQAIESLDDRRRPAGGGRVTLGVRRQPGNDDDVWVIEVTNNGPQIPNADLEHIFDPFVTNKDRGAGLGLSIASRIVEQHEGFIRAENLQGDQGVRFSVFLPGASPAPQR